MPSMAHRAEHTVTIAQVSAVQVHLECRFRQRHGDPQTGERASRTHSSTKLRDRPCHNGHPRGAHSRLPADSPPDSSLALGVDRPCSRGVLFDPATIGVSADGHPIAHGVTQRRTDRRCRGSNRFDADLDTVIEAIGDARIVPLLPALVGQAVPGSESRPKNAPERVRSARGERRFRVSLRRLDEDIDLLAREGVERVGAHRVDHLQDARVDALG